MYHVHVDQGHSKRSGGQVLAGPQFLNIKQHSILQKASNKQKY